MDNKTQQLKEEQKRLFKEYKEETGDESRKFILASQIDAIRNELKGRQDAQKEIIDEFLQEIERIRRLPEQYMEWKGYRNLPKFIEELQQNKEMGE